jgi:dinuclear metal center YbgI/SA1388 family protein
MNRKDKRSVPSSKLISFLDDFLETHLFPDDPRAQNGLQLTPPPRIDRVATAVDLCLSTVEKARSFSPQLLIVHHGLLWDGNAPWTGNRYAILKLLIEEGIGVYSVHLPLDAHPELGNNILLARALRLRNLKPFGRYSGKTIGWIGSAPPHFTKSRAESDLGYELKELVPPRALKRIAILSGNGRGFVREAVESGADLLLTGEVDHHASVLARDLGLGIWAGGHYHTETLGVQALGKLLEKRFGIEHRFIEDPL